MNTIINIAGYKFIGLDDLPQLRQHLREACFSLKLKGTILLSEEGINIMLAGVQAAIDRFKLLLNEDERLLNMSFKESTSEVQPFKRMLVKIKKEIITLGKPSIRPDKTRAPAISPQELKNWLDENREFILLDTRNNYEIEYGSFNKAMHLGIKHFSEFPQAAQQFSKEDKNKPVVMFCTGGIRCEKAALMLLEQGFKDVQQLDGGILNYFAQCGGAHYERKCFVFDERVAIAPMKNV